ncbi:MAG: 50S ribosomal protein L22 [Kosmotogaceae bacterium]|nr:50S ribosomal protein L22 [Kosmotogaceae bacterium]
MKGDAEMAQASQRDKRSVLHRKRKEESAATPVTQAKAVAKFVRISPRKARSVVNAIRNREVGEAFQILEFSPKKASRLVYKVLRSAVANAENNFGLNIDSLYVEKAVVDDGPRMKRLWPRGRGRADIQQKRFSHITVVVANREEISNPQE